MGGPGCRRYFVDQLEEIARGNLDPRPHFPCNGSRPGTLALVVNAAGSDGEIVGRRDDASSIEHTACANGQVTPGNQGCRGRVLVNHGLEGLVDMHRAPHPPRSLAMLDAVDGHVAIGDLVAGPELVAFVDETGCLQVDVTGRLDSPGAVEEGCRSAARGDAGNQQIAQAVHIRVAIAEIGGANRHVPPTEQQASTSVGSLVVVDGLGDQVQVA